MRSGRSRFSPRVEYCKREVSADRSPMSCYQASAILAGVGLFGVLTARKLLILGSATPAKKAPLPDPLYVYCTKILSALESNRRHMAATVSHTFLGIDRKST